jgi:hypothetical protein
MGIKDFLFGKEKIIADRYIGRLILFFIVKILRIIASKNDIKDFWLNFKSHSRSKKINVQREE